MANLRAINFDKMLDIYSEVKNLVKLCNASLRSALSKISRKLFNLTNWNASNEMYWEYLSYAATRLNILYNSNIDGIIKEIILKIYNKIIAILPENFQLLLFAEDADFGWDFKMNLSDFATKNIRYVPNKFWDTLKKLFPPMRIKGKPVNLIESKYTQISLNLIQTSIIYRVAVNVDKDSDSNANIYRRREHMANNNPFGRERRKPGIQALPEERKRGVTIRFLPEMKDDIYDLRDWLEREGTKGKRLLSQILKYQGKIDDLLTKLKGNKKEEETSLPPLPNYEDLKKGTEVEALREENQRLKAELENLREVVNLSKKACLKNKHCLNQSGTYVGLDCQTYQTMRDLLKRV